MPTWILRCFLYCAEARHDAYYLQRFPVSNPGVGWVIGGRGDGKPGLVALSSNLLDKIPVQLEWYDFMVRASSRRGDWRRGVGEELRLKPPDALKIMLDDDDAPS
jgi:hypothetical protein